MVKTTIVVKRRKKADRDVRIFFKIKNKKLLKSFVIKLSTRACVTSSFESSEFNYDGRNYRIPSSNEIQLLVIELLKKLYEKEFICNAKRN